jgi:uncharacterized protein (TIGR04255 family)
MNDDPLPRFAAPPVNEVVLGIQSDKLALATPYLGIYWLDIRDRYPEVEVHPALDPVTERFGSQPQTIGPALGLRIVERPETPRCWFVDAQGSRLIQLQQDRFLHNWRRTGDGDTYPHYDAVRGTFVEEYRGLQKFVDRQQGRAGALSPDWCELTYINHLPQGQGWNTLGELHQVFTVVARPSGELLPQPDFGELALAYSITNDGGEPIGRLHTSVRIAVRRMDGAPLLRFELTARGLPSDPSLEGVLSFMDRAHRWIVQAFTDLTTPSMHAIWRREDG